LAPRLRAEDDVLRHSHRVHQHEVLMNHANPQGDRVVRGCNVADLSFNQNLTRIGLVKSIRDTHRGGFAGAILSHDRVNRTGLDDDVHLVVGENVPESLGDVSKFNH